MIRILTVYRLILLSCIVGCFNAADVAVDGQDETASSNEATETTSGNAAQTNSTFSNISPFETLFGSTLMYLAPSGDGKSVQPQSKSTKEALFGKNVVGVYFSADWCGPCRKFTPELVSFYTKINKRRRDDFEIVWVSRCRAVQAHWEFFAHMGGWMSLPPEEAMGQRGSNLNDLFKVKGIPTLVLLDSQGNVITKDGRNKIPQDKAGIGFPWRNPIATLYVSLVPQSVRSLAKRQLTTLGHRLQTRLGRSLNAAKSKSNAKERVAA